MLSIAHAPTGALIASKIPNPLISIPLVLAAHYFEDSIPHWDVGTGMGNKKDGKHKALLQELFIDLPSSFVIVFLFFQYGHATIVWQAWLGWFFALLPDFLDAPAWFFKVKFSPLTYLSKLHDKVHHSTPNKFLGLLPQVIVIALAYFLR